MPRLFAEIQRLPSRYRVALHCAAIAGVLLASCCHQRAAGQTPATRFDWEQLPDLPDPLGVAGPFVGVHRDALIVAGGANFPTPVWTNEKVWRDKIYVLSRQEGKLQWQTGGTLPAPMAYGCSVSTEAGVLCIGGNDAKQTFRSTFLLSWDVQRQRLERQTYPDLPQPCAFAAATRIGKHVYVAGGQTGLTLDTATKSFWRLDLSAPAAAASWTELPAWPGPARALHLVASQHNGSEQCVYVISGRRQSGEEVSFLKDVWEYRPSVREWRRLADAPQCVMAGAAIDISHHQIAVLGGATGELFFQADTLRDKHPGFPKQSFVFDTQHNRWRQANSTPANHVTTIAVRWNDAIIIASGEVRPRVRSPKVFAVRERSGNKKSP